MLATPVASVAGALYPGHDRLVWHSLAVLRQAQVAHEVDETRGKVQLAAKLAGCIVIGERVVVIVESLAWKVRKSKQRTEVSDHNSERQLLGHATCQIMQGRMMSGRHLDSFKKISC